MDLSLFKIIAAIVVLLIALIGGIWPFKKRAEVRNDTNTFELDFPVSESLASGIFLGASLLHLLPDAVDDFYKAGFHYPFPFLIASLSFLALLLLEHIGASLKTQTHLSMALLTALMLSIHSLFEGAAVGFSNDFITAVIIFIAIIAHKGAASFALAVTLNRSHKISFLVAMIAFVFFVLMTPLGIVGGDWIASTTASYSLLTAIFNSLAAGTFLYIGTLHGLDRANLIRHCCNLKEFSAMLLGFTIMAIVGIWL